MHSYSAPDLQSFPLTMIVSNILDPNGKGFLKKISSEILHRNTQPIIVVDQQGRVVITNQAFNQLCCSKTLAIENRYDVYGNFTVVPSGLFDVNFQYWYTFIANILSASMINKER